MNLEPDSVTTVLGDIKGEQLGVTLVHEHVIADMRALQTEAFHPSRLILRDSAVDSVNPTLLRRDPLVCTDNCLLQDETTAVAELLVYHQAGGQSVVECSCVGLGRDPAALRRVAAATKIQLVAPTGFYLWRSIDAATLELTVSDLAAQMIRELTVGIGDSGVRAGFIGEVGTSAPLHPFEARVLEAAARAYSATGKPINVHLDPGGQEGERVLDILLTGGVPPGRIIMGHIDLPVTTDLQYVLRLAATGVFLGLDSFGTTFAYDSDQASDPTDTDRMILLKVLSDSGLDSQIVLSQDVGMKCQLLQHGGAGYAHLMANLLPAMISRGVSDRVLYKGLVDNPRRWLAPGSRAGSGNYKLR